MSDILKAITPLTFEEHELSEGYSSIIYDKNGVAIDGHNDAKTAAAIVTAVNSYEPMLAALEAVLGRYVDLVNCGDCGHWNPETEDEVIAARAAIALAKLEGEKP